MFGAVWPMPGKTDLLPPARDDTAPCVGCGLCCDGTIFNHAVVTPGEEPRLLAHGMELVTRDEGTVFLQPCRFASCGQCSNYAGRFDICRSFRCALLKRYQAGEIDLPAARATVEEAMKLIALVTANDPEAALFENRRRARAELAQRLTEVAVEDRPAIARRLLNMVALDEFLARRFRNKKKQRDNAESEPTRP